MSFVIRSSSIPLAAACVLMMAAPVFAQMQTEECGEEKVEVMNTSTGEDECAPQPDVTCDQDSELVYDGSWACVAVASETQEPAEGEAKRQKGVWSKTGDKKGGDWVHFNVVCRQHWHCNPTQDMLSASPVHTTPNKWTTGVCTATRFDPRCGSCLANVPDEPCEVWLGKDG